MKITIDGKPVKLVRFCECDGAYSDIKYFYGPEDLTEDKIRELERKHDGLIHLKHEELKSVREQIEKIRKSTIKLPRSHKKYSEQHQEFLEKTKHLQKKLLSIEERYRQMVCGCGDSFIDYLKSVIPLSDLDDEEGLIEI